MKTAISIVFAILLTGCSSHPVVVEQLKIGMTKSQVEKVQGAPENVETSGNYTALRYETNYYVILEHDRVTQFGRGTLSHYPGSDRYFINESYD